MKKRQRLFLDLGTVAVLTAAATLVRAALERTITYFHNPAGLAAMETKAHRPVRIGGLAEEGRVLAYAEGFGTSAPRIVVAGVTRFPRPE